MSIRIQRLLGDLLILVLAAFPASRVSGEILTDLSLASSNILYNGSVVDDGDSGGSVSGIPALGATEHAAGFTANVEFTPSAADLVGTVLLMELGGTSNGWGLYLVDGVPTLMMKQSSAQAATPSSLNDLSLPEVAVQSSFGTCTTGTTYSASLAWNHITTTVELLLKPTGSNLVSDAFALTGPTGDWSGNDTLSVGTFSDLGSVGGLAGFDLDPWDVADLKAFSGTIVAAQLWNEPGLVPATRPHIVLILVDDLSYSDLGCYGSEISTPTIDSLGTNGLRFTHCYNSARCSPTRAALLTGQHPHSVFTNPGGSLSPVRSDNNVTIAEILGGNGYNTYAVGKWHVGSSETQKPEARGFNHFWGFKDDDHSKDMWDESNYRYFSSNNVIPALTYGPGEFYQTDAIGDYATNFLDHAISEGKPFFIYMAFGAPHFPVQARTNLIDQYVSTYQVGWEAIRSNRYAQMQSLGLISDPPSLLSPPSDSPQWAAAGVTPIPDWDPLSADRKAHAGRLMASYAAMIDSLDANIGKVTDLLDQQGLLNDTLIIFVSDNGACHEGGVFGSIGFGANTPPLTGADLLTMGQPGEPEPYLGGAWANAANTPYTYYKRNCHEGGIASPLVVSWPNGITRTPGEFARAPVHVMDVMPTILDINGFTYPAMYDGRTVIPREPQSQTMLPQFAAETPAPRTLGFEHEQNRAFRDGDWKLVTKNYSDARHIANKLELYNLAADPVELNNLALIHPEIVETLVTNWNAWAARVGVPANRWITFVPQSDPPDMPDIDLFIDRFNRDDHADHEAESGGMSGSLVPPLGAGAAYEDSWEAGAIEIADLTLRMAEGSGMSETAVKHNFIDQAILDAGGFTVQLQVHEINSATNDIQNRYAGFGVGLTEVESQAGNDIYAAGPPHSFRGSSSVMGACDFFLELDLDGNVKAWANGTLLETIPVGATSGILTASYELDSFAAGSNVTVTAYFGDQVLDLDSGGPSTSRVFPWDSTDMNFVGLSARASSYVLVDNLAIRLRPVSKALAAAYAMQAGLSGTEAALDGDPDEDGLDTFYEWLLNDDPTNGEMPSKLIWVDPVVNGEFRFNHIQRIQPASAGLSYEFHRTEDLMGGWLPFTPEMISSQGVSATHQESLMRVPAAVIGSSTGLFVRIAVNYN